MEQNVIYVRGLVPGDTNAIVNIMETTLPLRFIKSIIYTRILNL